MSTYQQELEVLIALDALAKLEKEMNGRKGYFTVQVIYDVIPNNAVAIEDLQPLLIELVLMKRAIVFPYGDSNDRFKISKEGRLFIKQLTV